MGQASLQLSIMRPRPVVWSERIQLGLLLEPVIRGLTDEQGVFITIIGWIILLIPAYIIISATRLKKEWARDLLLVLAIGGLVMTLFSRDLLAFEEPRRIIASVTSVLNIIGVGLLFLPSTDAWFAEPMNASKVKADE